MLFRAQIAILAGAVMTLFPAPAPGSPDQPTTPTAARAADAATSRPMDFLFTARSTQWGYPRDITPAQADDYVTSLAANGINMLLSENHRSLVNDWPSKPDDIAEIAALGGAEVSLAATKIVADACSRHGIRFVHHITSTFCTKQYLDAHPEWAQVDARTGEPAYFAMYGGLWLLCPNNPEWRAFYIDLIADFTRRTGVDGWMVDEMEFLPDWHVCGCTHCRAKFKAETKFDLPTGRDSDVWQNFDSAVWRAWLRFRKKSGGDFFADLKKKLDEVAPDQVLTGCVAGASEAFLPQYWGMDAAELARAGNFPFYECWLGKGLPFMGWRRCIAEMRLYDALARPHGTAALTLFYPASRDEIVPCWAMCNVAGNRFWALNPGAPGYARHQAFSLDDGFFAWEARHADLFGPQETLAELALLFPSQTRDCMPTKDGAAMAEFAVTPRNQLGGKDLVACVNEWAGWAEVLTASNLPHDVVREEQLTTAGLARYRALVMPAALALSEAQCRAVLDFVARGGRLVTTGETGVMDETGAPRADKALVEQMRAAGTRMEDNPGSASLLGFVVCDMPYGGPDDPGAPARVRKAAAEANDPAPWAVENAREGLVAGVFRRNDGAIVAHLLNATGTALDTGTTTPAEGTYKPVYPPVTGATLRLRPDVAATVDPGTAQWIPYPGHDRVAVKTIRTPDGALLVEIPRIDIYGVVRIGAAMK